MPICKICNIEKPNNEFWEKHSRKDDSIILETMCRDCISKTIDCSNFFSLVLICLKLNIPYCYNTWQELINKYGTTQNRKIISKYLAIMHLPAYKSMRFKDSEMFRV